MTKSTGEDKVKRSLLEFARDKRREKCAVCQVSESVRLEMRAARDKKISQDVVLQWLKNEHGVEIVADELVSHNSGHHDRHLKELES